MRRAHGDRALRYAKPNGLLRLIETIADRGGFLSVGDGYHRADNAAKCGINDFSFSDLLKPTHDRLVKIFSYIINFVRFRESQTATIDEHFNKAETTKARIETLYLENQDMASRLDALNRERKAMESRIREKTKRNEDSKIRLLELKDGQARVQDKMERVKTEKDRLAKLLQERTQRHLELQHDSEKLRPYASQSSSALQGSLTELSDSLSRDKSTIDALEKRTRALQTSAETFNAAATDVLSCTKVLDEVVTEQAKEDEESQQALRRRDALTERGNNVREVERTEALLQRQLSRWMERTEALRRGSQEKANGARVRMEELRNIHRGLAEERGDRGREMERRRVRIEQTEKKVSCFFSVVNFSLVFFFFRF